MGASEEVLRYGIADVSEMTGISAYTIRYYDKCGFFPELLRDASGVRSFADSDVKQLLFVDALRKSGLSIEGIQYYVRLQKRSEETLEERRGILKAQCTSMELQLSDMQACLERLRAAGMELEAAAGAEEGPVL